MRTKLFLLTSLFALVLSGCASYQGGTSDQYDTTVNSGDSLGQSNPEPAASPTFRPGINPNDPRDPHFTTRPEPQASPSTTP